MGVFCSPGMSPHCCGAGVKAISIRSILDLKVWTIKGKNVKEEKKSPAKIGRAQLSFLRWSLEMH